MGNNIGYNWLKVQQKRISLLLIMDSFSFACKNATKQFHDSKTGSSVFCQGCNVNVDSFSPKIHLLLQLRTSKKGWAA